MDAGTLSEEVALEIAAARQVSGPGWVQMGPRKVPGCKGADPRSRHPISTLQAKAAAAAARRKSLAASQQATQDMKAAEASDMRGQMQACMTGVGSC